MKKWILILIAGGLFLLLLKKKGPTMILTEVTKKRSVTEAQIKSAMNVVKKTYGDVIAAKTEKQFRLESGHFGSDTFLYTLGAGMLKAGKVFPWGWTTKFLTFWTTHPQYAPNGIFSRYIVVDPKTGVGKYVTPTTPGAKVYNYLSFPSLEAGLMTLADYVNRFPQENWVGSNAQERAKYLALLNKISPRYV